MEGFEIKKFPSRVLRKTSRAVKELSSREKDLLDKMVRTMYENRGIGLAGPQIGVDAQLAVVDVGDGPIKLVNPKILKKEGFDRVEEECLSIPGVSVKVKRARKILVQFTDEEGKPATLEAQGLLARAIQHEIDHLNGHLIIDYLNPIKRLFVKHNLSKAKHSE